MKKLKKMIYLKFARSMNKNNSDSPVPTIISENTKVIGDVISSATLHIDGHVEGDITCDELIIGVRGTVEGSVTAKTLQLYGTLSGKAAAEKIFIAKSAKLLGDATHSSIAIEPGAYIDGRCMRVGDPIPAEAAQPDLMITDASKNKKNIERK